jgi:hypothetical protein
VARWPGDALGAGLARDDEAFEPHGVEGLGLHRQPVAVRLPLDHPVRQCLSQPGNQARSGVRRIGGRVLPPIQSTSDAALTTTGGTIPTGDIAYWSGPYFGSKSCSWNPTMAIKCPPMRPSASTPAP